MPLHSPPPLKKRPPLKPPQRPLLPLLPNKLV